MNEYVKLKKVKGMPRLPLEGQLDLTYRCNNNCRHCWLRIPPEAKEKEQELTFDEIRVIADEARSLGCQRWYISGGEPMLRSDFVEIFDYLTRVARSYYLNTNGTLITPRIARLMKRKGVKLIALYGATAEVHDHITRTPGSFAAAMQGAAYLKEAGANFMVQFVPMKANIHQFQDMMKLAQSLGSAWRLSSPFIFLSASGDRGKNLEIGAQRLSPAMAAEIEFNDSNHEEPDTPELHCRSGSAGASDRILEGCVTTNCRFHIDPYGAMNFCQLITDSGLRYNLKRGNFREGWENFIPALGVTIRGGKEYLDNCGTCRSRSNCWWCPGYAYLEHRRSSAKIDYLCAVAKKHRALEKKWQASHRRYYQLGGMTIEVSADLPITDTTFQKRFKPFAVKQPGDDVIAIHHHFFLPEVRGQDLGVAVYRKPPLAIYKKESSWIYLGFSSRRGEDHTHRLGVCNHTYSRIRIYNQTDKFFRRGNLNALTLMASDQILLTQPLAEREGCYIHASGVKFLGTGMLFVGHSDAGKSTMVKMLKGKAEILCDDRIIVRRQRGGFWIYGTWSHGEIPTVSASGAPLKAIFFLKKARTNRIQPVESRSESIKRLLACLIRSYTPGDWWEKMLSLFERVGQEVPCYNLYFDKSGRVVAVLEEFCREEGKKKVGLPSRAEIG